MKKTLVAFGLALAAMVGTASPALAGSITINQSNGTIYVTDGLTGFSTTGSMMDGMLFTVTDTSGSVTSAAWATTAGDCGAAVGAGWSVSECGDTYSWGDNWTLTSETPIASILINAAPGNAVFDLTFPILGTTGSSAGFWFSSANNPFDITATYLNAVALTGNAPLGDLYHLLRLDFAQPFTGTLLFTQDTDSLASPLNIQEVPAPEPASLLLLGTGLIGVARARRRKK